jgi:hypothetical protein
MQWACPSRLFMFGSVTNGMFVLLACSVSVRCRTPDFTQDARAVAYAHMTEKCPGLTTPFMNAAVT